MVAISSNDTGISPDDDVTGLRSQIEGAGFAFPYLLNAREEAAVTFHAACTPDFFLYDAQRLLAIPGARWTVPAGQRRARDRWTCCGWRSTGCSRESRCPNPAPSIGRSITPRNEPTVVFHGTQSAAAARARARSGGRPSRPAIAPSRDPAFVALGPRAEIRPQPAQAVRACAHNRRPVAVCSTLTMVRPSLKSVQTQAEPGSLFVVLGRIVIRQYHALHMAIMHDESLMVIELRLAWTAMSGRPT